MNIRSNPWSFTPADVVTASLVASPGGITLNSDGTATMTATGPLPASFVAGAYLTLINVTNSAYNGFYQILNTATPVATLRVVNNFVPKGTAASGGGTAALNNYPYEARIEDLSWQQATAGGDQLNIYDKNANIIWFATCPATLPGYQNRGKLFWVDGVTITKMDSGIVLATIN